MDLDNNNSVTLESGVEGKVVKWEGEKSAIFVYISSLQSKHHHALSISLHSNNDLNLNIQGLACAMTDSILFPAMSV